MNYKHIVGLSISLFLMDLTYCLAGNQPVVAELMTATWCPHCPSAEKALTQLEEKYDSSKLIILEYHPTSDEFGTQRIDSRISYYNSRGFPTIFFNGTKSIVGAGEGTLQEYEKNIKSIGTKPSGIDITMDGKIDSSLATASATITLDKKTSIAGMTLRWIFFQKTARSKSKTFSHVVRDYIYKYAIIKPGETKTFTTNFAAPYGVDAKNLGIALLIQDDGSKEIAQSAVTTLASAKGK